MKRPVYLASSVLLLASTMLATNVLAAGAHHSTQAKMIQLQLCSSTPFGVPALKQLSQGIRNGEHLATFHLRAKLKKAGVQLLPPMDMDDAKADGSTYDPNKEGQNALSCVNSAHTIGYVGTLNSGAAIVSEPITNKAHMVQISPANTSPSLTSFGPYQGSGGRKSQEPATFKHQIPYVTYYRTVTTDALQGPAGALFAKNNLHVSSVYVVDDKLQYGVGLAQAFKAEAQKIGLKVLGYSHVDSSSAAAEAQTANQIASSVVSAKPGLVYCGCDSETVGALPRDLRHAGYQGPWMGGDALYNSAWITTEGSASVNNYATSVGPDPAKTSQNFKKLYKKVYGGFYGNPGVQAYDAPSYDATSIILTAVWEAAKAHKLTGSIKHMRTVVVGYVRHIKYFGATGETSFDANGDTTNRVISVYKVQGGKYIYHGALKPTGFKPAP